MFAKLLQVSSLLVAVVLVCLFMSGFARSLCAQNAADGKPMPHGGQAVSEAPFVFEVVFHSTDVRVYAYRPSSKPYSLKDVDGTLALKSLQDDKVTPLKLKLAAVPNGEQDYLSVSVDLRRAKERNLVATIKLQDRSGKDALKAEFSRAVTISEPKVTVTIGELDKSDEEGIARQKTCPVTGAELGSMGDPVKVLINGKPLFLCCEGCVPKVKSAPEIYLKKMEKASQSR
jgi:hypothetical protein